MEQEKQTNAPYGYPNRNDACLNPQDGNRTFPQSPNALARASKVMGILAILFTLTLTVYPSIVLGALAIILALLSRGGALKLHPSAKTGVVTSSVAMGINVALIAAVFIIALTPGFQESFNKTWESIYGIPFEETMEGIQNGTLDYEDIYQNVYDNMYNEENNNK